MKHGYENHMMVDTTNGMTSNGKVAGNMAEEKTKMQEGKRRAMWGKEIKNPMGPEEYKDM